MFYLKDKERNRRAEETGEAETKRIVQQVMNKELGHTLPNQMSALGAAAAKANYNRIRKTKRFKLDSSNNSISYGFFSKSGYDGGISRSIHWMT